MSCPKTLVHKNGSEYSFVKVLPHFKGLSFLYKQKDDHMNSFVVLSPKKIEKNFINRPRPKSETIKQSPFGCVVASIAMLTKRSKKEVEEAISSQEVDFTEGMDLEVISSTLKALGFSVNVSSIRPKGDCIFSVDSLNVQGLYHCLYFDGEEILDPQMGNEGFLWYGADWSPEMLSGFDFISVIPLRN